MAARPFNVIAVGAGTLEGMRVRGSEMVEGSGLSRRFDPGAEEFFAALGQQMDEVALGEGWTGAQAALVVPSGQISLRKLEFPFRDPRKIDQALSFELENELLEDVTNFVYTYTVLPEEDEYATVLVYLVPTAYLHGLLDVLHERHLTPIRVTFSAQVLCQLHPPAGELHYQIYVGADEAFVSCVAGGHVQAVKTFPLNVEAGRPGEGGLNGGDGEGVASPEALLRLAGEEAEAAEGAPKGKRKPRLREELEALAGDVMRFIGPHSMGQAYTVSLHGLFAPLFHWDEQQGRLTLPAPGESAGAWRRPGYWGIIQELTADPGVLLSQSSINFFRHTTGWWQQVKEYRRPLAVMAVLAAVIAAMLGTDYGMRVAALQGELTRLDGQIQGLLERSLNRKYSVVQGVRVLEERLANQRKESAAIERFEPYRYGTMGLMQDLSALFAKYPQLTLSTLTLKGDRLTISGTTKSYNDSESFRNRLLELERFKGSEAGITHQRNRSEITYRIIIDRKAP